MAGDFELGCSRSVDPGLKPSATDNSALRCCAVNANKRMTLATKVKWE